MHLQNLVAIGHAIRDIALHLVDVTAIQQIRNVVWLALEHFIVIGQGVIVIAQPHLGVGAPLINTLIIRSNFQRRIVIFDRLLELLLRGQGVGPLLEGQGIAFIITMIQLGGLLVGLNRFIVILPLERLGTLFG